MSDQQRATPRKKLQPKESSTSSTVQKDAGVTHRDAASDAYFGVEGAMVPKRLDPEEQEALSALARRMRKLAPPEDCN